MRDLLRTRKQLVRERTGHTQRIQKTLEDANIKFDSVISNIVGISGRRMVEALIDGQTDPETLAALADGRLKATPAELEASLRGRVTAHHRFLLRLHLDQLDALDAAIARIDQEVDSNAEPFRVAIEMLATIPGVSNLSAEVIVSEIGIDMSRFRTEGHLISWAGLCSKNDESAGKRRSTRMKKGASWLKTTLIQCAWAATRTKGTYLHAQYLRLRSRCGPKRAIGAVAASILTAAYHMLKNGTLYQDLGANHFDNRAKGKQVLQLLNRLRNLGFAVQITPVAV
jgi:transposase